MRTLVEEGRLARARSEACRQIAAGAYELGEGDARRLLDGVVGLGPARVARDPQQAVLAAREIGFPVVLKALAPGVLHKSDHDLVRVGLADEATVERVAGELIERARRLSGEDAWELSVQAHLAGVEFAVGVRRNELGPFCMVAAGGVLVEVLDDSAVGMAPLSREAAAALLNRLRSAPLLDGYRGSSPLDREALVEILVGVGKLAAAVPELVELDLNPVFVGPSGALAADARCVLAPVEDQEAPREPAGATVRDIFEPRRIAVVGASRDRRKPGGLLLRYLRQGGYAGEIVAINPRDLDLDGVRTYPRLEAVEAKVDLACIAVPAAHVRGVIEECVSAGVRAGIVYSAGYAESGIDGSNAQRDLLDCAGEDFRFVGPNSNGVASPARGLLATFGMSLEGQIPPVGPVAIVSQSGAIASALVSRTHEFGIGLSHWISTGNEADLGVADYIDYLAEESASKVICLFLEVIRNPQAFREACRRARLAGKAVIALKIGRSEAGRAAAASHTGAMTGSDRTYEAFLDSCGVLRVPDLAGLFAAAQGVLLAGEAQGRRVAVISMSGGACSIIADACQDAGLEVPDLPVETQAALGELLPAFAGVRNPVDVTAEGIGSPELVRRAVEVVRSSAAVDLVLVQLGTNADPSAEAMAADLVEIVGEDRIPLLVGRLGSAELAPRALERYRAGGMHVFTWPEHLVEAARAATWCGERRRACLADEVRP